MTPSTRRPWRNALAAVAALGLLWSGAACDGGVTRPWSQQDTEQLEELRADLEALTRVQTVLQWYSASQGEPQIQAETYQISGALFTPEKVSLVERALERTTLAPNERRALEYLRGYLAIESIRVQTSRIDDQVANAETNYKVNLSWLDEPVPFRELDALLGAETDEGHRQEIHKQMTRFWRDAINPLMAEKEDLSHKLAVQAGYPSYIALCEAYRQAEVVPLAQAARAFIEDTQPLYESMLEFEAQEILGKSSKQMHRSDVNILANPPDFNKFFPAELQLAAFDHLLSGIGLELKTHNGTPITIDDNPNPLKETTATSYPVSVPDDIRINLRPVGGLDDFTSLFYEGARALHFGWTDTDTWEFKYIGPMATSEGYGEFFNYVWSDPRWLVRYRKFVIAYNETHPEAVVPVMTYQELGRLVRHRIFWDLYYLRRYAFARVSYEYFLHGGPPAALSQVYNEPTDDLQEVYRKLFSRAYGFELTAEEALRFRTDVDDYFLSLDYSRSFLFAHSLHEAVRNQFGYNWYEKPEVGASLKRLWAAGTRTNPEEALGQLGQERLDFSAVRGRLERLLREAEALGPGSTGDSLDKLLEDKSKSVK